MKHIHSNSLLAVLIAHMLTCAILVRGEEPAAEAPLAPAIEKSGPPAAIVPAETDSAPPTAAPEPSPPPPAPTAAPAPSNDESAAQAAASEPANEPEAIPPPKDELRRPDDEAKEPSPESRPDAAKAVKKAARRRAHASNEIVSFGHDSRVRRDEKASQVVSIFGSTTVDGEVAGEAVSIFGNTTINGSVRGKAVAVMGSVYVNGAVGGQVVAVMGNVELGPAAVVGGQIVTIGGALQRDPQAIVRGPVHEISLGHRFPEFGWLHAWIASALLKGRLLSFDAGAAWAWVVVAIFLGFYALLALLFRPGVEKCAETIEKHPGFTILAALLAMLAAPLVFLLLAITGVGVLVIPVLLIALFAGKLFGRAAILAWFGRRLVGLFGQGPYPHAAVTVLIGGAAVALLYLVPVLAFVVLVFNGILGLGAVVYTLVLSMRRNGAKPVIPALPQAPVVSAVTLPRVGFWIRLVASFLDAILIGVAAAMLHTPGGFLLLFAGYCVVLWALKGSTIGGIICGLKVVRVDDRPVDWSVAVVRALAGFLSLAVIGLGFIWVAFDAEKQSWHDKIAGTTIVKVPKTISLV